MENNGVVYIDPFGDEYIESNHMFSNDVNGMICPVTPPLEDFCIVVGLEVQVSSRKHIGISSADKVYRVTFSSSANSKSDVVSFFSGTKHRFSNGTSQNEINYLTSDASTFGTFDEAINSGTTECFGIKSIDIQYNNYNTPVVTIEFTDIRGISLFAPEELRHRKRDGMGNDGSIDNDIAGSFFKCFFTSPYPLFTLYVKGFYGKMASYQLTISDFRASFDSSTGNFNAKAELIGYMFSILNDVTINSLIAAPLSEYIGKSYWNKQVNEGIFSFDDGTPMITLNELFKRISEIKGDDNKLDQSLLEKTNRLSSTEQSLNSLYDSYIDFYTKLLSNMEVYQKAMNENSKNSPVVYFDKKNKILLVFTLKDNGSNGYANVNGSLIDKYNNLIRLGKEHGIDFPTLKIELTQSSKGKINFSDCSSTIIDRMLKTYGDSFNSIYSRYSLFGNRPESYSFIEFNGSDAAVKIDTLRTKNGNDVKENQREITKSKQGDIIKRIGFAPTVQNMTKLILAHFDTFMHSVYSCTQSVTARTTSDLNIGKTDIKVGEDGVVCAFPRIEVSNTHNGIKTVEESWMGGIPEGKEQPETQLVEGILKGIELLRDSASKANEAVNTSGSEKSIKTVVEIPIIPSDIVHNMESEHPFGNVNFDDITDFAGRLGIRMAWIFGLVKVLNDAERMGKADAYNFFVKNSNRASKVFLQKLCGGEEAITSDTIIGLLTNAKKDEIQSLKKNGCFAWDNGNDKSYGIFVDCDGSYLYSYLRKFVDGNKHCYFVPTPDEKWSSIQSNFSSIADQDKFASTIETSVIDSSVNVIKIDTDYEKYGTLLDRMVLKDNTELDSKDEFEGMKFDSEDYLDKYYEEDDCFGKKFSEIKANEIKITNRIGSNVLPYPITNDYVESFGEITSGDSINGSSLGQSVSIYKKVNLKYDDDFSYIYDESLEKRHRPNGDIDDTANEINAITTFTIPYFNGISVERNRLTNGFSLFGQKEYYNLSVEARALTFLESFKYEGISLGKGILKFSSAVSEIIDTKKYFSIIPYADLLLIGGYLWRDKNYNVNILSPILPKKKFQLRYSTLINNNIYGYYSDSKGGTIYNLRKEIKNELISLFEQWVNDCSSGFGYIRSQFELTPKKGNASEFIDKAYDKLKEDKDNVVKYLIENVDETFFSNYISLKPFELNGVKYLKLYNRETSNAVERVANLLLKPCMVIKSTSYIYKDGYPTNDKLSGIITLNKGNVQKYVTSFLTELKTLYQDRYNEILKEGEVKVVESPTNEHIKIALYKYIKALYDKWFSGNEETIWNLNNFYGNHWHFIDSFYNKIGDRIFIDLNQFVSDMYHSTSVDTYAMVSFLSLMFQRCRFVMHVVQNFLDLNKKSTVDSFNKIFSLIPYNKIDFGDVDPIPSFVIMYCYEQSSKLNIEDSEFEDDSFDLSTNDVGKLPTPISTKDASNGYKIPAFGVTYGMQYQSIFKDISISMDNPMITEAAIRAQNAICGIYDDNNNENGKKLSALGQDLYTIYSNNSYTCNVRMMGCAWIQPLMYFQLNNIPMFRGAYLIQKVTHHIEPRKYGN